MRWADVIDWDLRCNGCGVLLFAEDDYHTTEDDRAYCAECWEEQE